MREDTKVRPYKNSFTLSLFQREREFWGRFTWVISKKKEAAI